MARMSKESTPHRNLFHAHLFHVLHVALLALLQRIKPTHNLLVLVLPVMPAGAGASASVAQPTSDCSTSCTIQPGPCPVFETIPPIKMA